VPTALACFWGERSVPALSSHRSSKIRSYRQPPTDLSTAVHNFISAALGRLEPLLTVFLADTELKGGVVIEGA
jgi:hypothetical protein